MQISILFLSLLTASSCTVVAPSATQYGPRTLILDDTTVSELQKGGFTCWYCKDFVSRGNNLVELGFFNTPASKEKAGFILFDNGYVGTKAEYYREGLEHRWNWEFNGEIFLYSFVIQPDGKGLYYDFSRTPPSEDAMPSDLYKCYLRKR